MNENFKLISGVNYYYYYTITLYFSKEINIKKYTYGGIALGSSSTWIYLTKFDNNKYK